MKIFSVINFRGTVEKDPKDALFHLGLMYFNGKRVPKNYVKAAKWFFKAANQGSLEAMHKLGEMYRYGDGVPQDDSEAIQWFRKSGKNEEDIVKIMNTIK